MNERKYLLKGIIAIFIVFAILIGQNAVIAEGEEEVVEEPTSTVPTLAEIDLGITDDPVGYDEVSGGTMYDINGNEQKMYFDWVNNMPTWRSPSGLTGTLPEYFSEGSNFERKVYLGQSRTNLDTKEWNAKIEEGVLYCKSYGAFIKSGHIDTEKRFLTAERIDLGPNGTIPSPIEREECMDYKQVTEAEVFFGNIQTEYTDVEQHEVRGMAMFSTVYNIGVSDSNGNSGSSYNIRWGSAFNIGALGYYLDVRKSGNALGPYDLENQKRNASDRAFDVLQDILRMAEGEKVEKDTEDETTDGTKRQSEEELKLGVNIGVMETEDGTENHYSLNDEIGTFSSDSLNKIEIQKSYILTALENVYNYEKGVWKPTEEKLSKMYSLNDIQVAYWLVLNDENQSEANPFGENEKDIYLSKRLTNAPKGKELYEKSLEYADFVMDNIAGKYNKKVEIDGTLATFDVKVTNSARTQAEIVSGPYTITYPYYDDAPDISYVKALKITTNTGKTLIYSEEKSDFEIVTTKDTQGANGIGEGTKKFPASGSSFYVKFKVNNEECPKAISVSGEFEYLDYTSVKHQVVYSLGHVYRYEPYDGREGYGMVEGANTVRYTIAGLMYQEDRTLPPEGWDWDCDCEWYNGSYVDSDGKSDPRWVHYGDDGGNPPCCTHCGTAKKPRYPWSYQYGTTSDSYDFFWVQPFLKMTDEPIPEEEQKPQNFTLARDGYRRYKTVIATSTTPDIPNKPKQEKVNFNGTKKWEETFDIYNNTITEITVKLVQNGKVVSTQTTSKSNGWQYSFKNWPKYDENGKEYNYFVIDNVTGYAVKTNGSWLINDEKPRTEEEKIEKEVRKIWDDANNAFRKRPAEVKVTLQRVNYKGEVTDVATATLKEDPSNPANSWYYKFTNLDKYEEVDGIKYEYVYKFKEDPVPNYITKYNGNEIHNIYGDFDISINLGGFVWVDVNSGKETVANGTYDNLYDGSESLVQGVNVKLYRADGKNFKNGKKYLETVTDKYGKYRFEGLDAMSLYKVEFTYNGQYYEATTYAGPNTWNTTDWEKNSNAKEAGSDRDALNDKFAAIGAYPNNYGTNLITYTWDQLSDKGVVDAVGNLNPEALSSSDSEIKSMVQFVQDCQIKATTDAAYPVSQLNKFFEGYDFKRYIEMISEASGGGLVVTDDEFAEFERLRTEIMKTATTNVQHIYDKAYYINLGLHPRQTTDLKLEKEIDKVTIEINGQKEDYESKNESLWRCEECHKPWKESELKVDLNDNFEYGYFCPECNSQHLTESSDVRARLNEKDNSKESFYNPNYVREIYPSDYEYQVDHYNGKIGDYGDDFKKYGKSAEDELQVYVTYKLTVTNQSSSIRTRVDEVVDYFDSEYEFVPERSYIKFQESALSDESDYEFIMSTSVDGSIVTPGTEKVIKNGDKAYQKVYVTGMGKGGADNFYLPADTRLNIYLTFKVKKDVDGKILLDEESDGKENLAEINGYATQYAPGTYVPNRDGVAAEVGGKNAGLIDMNSNPGNLDQDMLDEFIEWEKDPEKDIHKIILENDANKAPDVVLELAEGNDRVITGTVWEDLRNYLTEDTQNALIGDGIMQEGENAEPKINGVTVQLVEIMGEPEDEEHREYVWREFGSEFTGTTIEGTTVGTGKGSGMVESELPIIDGENVEPYTFEGNHDGMYAFKSFVPGRYVVRFIYGDTDRTVIDKGLAEVMGITNYNDKSYNGQDYKSTIYQKGVNQNTTQKINRETGKTEERDTTKWANANIDGNEANNRLTYIWRQKSEFENGEEILGKIISTVPTFKADASNNENITVYSLDEDSRNPEFLTSENLTYLVSYQDGYLYDISESEKYNGSSEEYPNVSDAKDIASRRTKVVDYSDENVTNSVAEVLASHKYDISSDMDNSTRRALLNELEKETYMTAQTGLMVIEVEYDNTEIQDGEALNDVENRYQIQNVNLGLVERPNAQLALNKEVKNVQLKLANGSTLFDASKTESNVLWKEHEKYEDIISFENRLKEKYTNVQTIANDHTLGLIQLTMDEEIMHGANIILDYDITVKNIGEIDYKDNLFYYTGKEENPTENIVKTTANEIIDYVANNLQFNAAENKEYWESISKDSLFEEGNELVNEQIKNEVQEFNTIIKIKDERLDNNELVPKVYKNKTGSEDEDSVTVPLKLSQLITSENDTDDLTYKNIAEIVKTSNTVGRRMEFSVVGNQDPTENPKEMDSDASQLVRILPPFGETTNYILISIIAIISIGIVVVGIIFIKKKILK